MRRHSILIPLLKGALFYEKTYGREVFLLEAKREQCPFRINIRKQIWRL